MSPSYTVPTPNSLLQSHWSWPVSALPCSVLSTKKWRVRRAARPRMHPAKLPDALIQDGPLRASMHPQCLRAKAGFADTVSVVTAKDIYTICFHTPPHSAVCCHYKHMAFYGAKMFLECAAPVGIKPPTQHYSLNYHETETTITFTFKMTVLRTVVLLIQSYRVVKLVENYLNNLNTFQ